MGGHEIKWILIIQWLSQEKSQIRFRSKGQLKIHLPKIQIKNTDDEVCLTLNQNPRSQTPRRNSAIALIEVFLNV